MALTKAGAAALGAAVALAAAVSGYAIAATDKTPMGNLADQEGILVDVKAFDIVKGKAKSEPTAALLKLGAKEVKDGAIVFRSGNKLYIADGTPIGGPQAMNPGDPLPTTIDGYNNLFQH